MFSYRKHVVFQKHNKMKLYRLILHDRSGTFSALVDGARKRELEYFDAKGVWHLRPREGAYRIIGKAPISVKWVDTNKQDDEN